MTETRDPGSRHDSVISHKTFSRLTFELLVILTAKQESFLFHLIHRPLYDQLRVYSPASSEARKYQVLLWFLFYLSLFLANLCMIWIARKSICGETLIQAQICLLICCTSESLGQLCKLLLTRSPTPVKSTYLDAAAEYVFLKMSHSNVRNHWSMLFPTQECLSFAHCL